AVEGEEAFEQNAAGLAAGVGADGRAAAAADGPQEGALELDASPGGLVVELGDDRGDVLAVGTDLEREGALSRSGEHDGRLQGLVRDVGAAEALDAGGRDDHGVELPVGEL